VLTEEVRALSSLGNGCVVFRGDFAWFWSVLTEEVRAISSLGNGCVVFRGDFAWFWSVLAEEVRALSSLGNGCFQKALFLSSHFCLTGLGLQFFPFRDRRLW
jgi:hypothetical protein